MDCEFSLVNQNIEKFFGESLVSLVIFGSSCRKKRFRVVSDIDYIIVLDKIVENQDIISRKLKNHLGDYLALLAFNIYDRRTFSNLIDNQDWLVLSIKLGYRTIVDRDNFFTKKVESRFKQIKAKKIAPLGWYIDKKFPDIELIKHLLGLSDEYLYGSQKLFESGKFRLANLLLLRSLHCFLSALLLKRNIFITRGEISQCFIKSYGIKSSRLAESLLEMEQVCGQIEEISFNFDKGGYMAYINSMDFLSNFYLEKRKVLMGLRKKFDYESQSY